MNHKSWKFRWHGWILGVHWSFQSNAGDVRGLVGISCSQLNQSIALPHHSLANEVPYESKMCRDMWDDRWGLEPCKRVIL